MNKKLYILAIIAVTLLSACEMLELKPLDKIDAEGAITSEKGLVAAITGAYDRLQSASLAQDAVIFADLAADNLIHIGTKKEYRQVSDNNIVPQNAYVEGLWNACYDGINRVNNVLNAIDNVPGISETKLNGYKSELYFLRAFNYFTLAKYFGGVPLRSKPISGIADSDLNVPRNTLTETYAFIISDLVKAIETNNKNGAAAALLARAYLYSSDYAKAANLAVSVISDFGYQLESGANYGKIFDETANSKENIFVVDFANDNDVNGLADWFMPNGRFELAAWNDVSKITSIANLFLPADLRQPHTLATGSVDGVTEHYCMKYTDVATDKDQTVLLRLAEMYLIAAEALNETAYSADGLAFTMLNTVRQRAGLPTLNSTQLTNQEQFRVAVLEERRLEFAFEGHRLFDLVRTKKTDAYLPAIGTLRNCNWLLPIPQSEMDTNKAMLQNQNY